MKVIVYSIFSNEKKRCLLFTNEYPQRFIEVTNTFRLRIIINTHACRNSMVDGNGKKINYLLMRREYRSKYVTKAAHACI